jgi:hypothetical protein
MKTSKKILWTVFILSRILVGEINKFQFRLFCKQSGKNGKTAFLVHTKSEKYAQYIKWPRENSTNTHVFAKIMDRDRDEEQ